MKHPLANPSGAKPLQKNLAQLLALGVPPDVAAKHLGVSKAYVTVLLKGGLFQSQIADERRQLIGERLEEYTKLVSEQLMPNLEALIAIRDDPKVPPSARLRAIELINDALVPKAGRRTEVAPEARVTFTVEQQADIQADIHEAIDVTPGDSTRD